MMKKKLLSDDVFLVDVYAITGTREEAQKFIDKEGVGQTLGGSGCCYALPDNKGFVLWLMYADDFYVLMHETLHLVVAIFEAKGINVNLANEEEVIAFYQSYWFRKLWRWFGKLETHKQTLEKGEK
jgi:hypothetical protein